jgi:light-regulated signal transduction histidine kinase (bacteriophytochrome)
MIEEAKAASEEETSGWTPHAIQPHGWMIACDHRAVTVRRHSANLDALFPGMAGAFLGAHLRDIIGSEASHALRNALSRFAGPARPALLPGYSLKGCEGVFDLAVYAVDDETFIEIERAGPGDPRAVFDRARAMIERISVLQDVDKLLQAAARLVSSLLLYGRVVVLRFDADGARVIADPKIREKEAGAARILSIPAETRRLYREGRLRVIVNGEGEPSAVISARDLETPDLGFAHLRAPSADESDRLGSAGHVASLSLAIIVGGELWGLLQCNDPAPKNPGMDLRAAAELFGDFLSRQVEVLLQREEIALLRQELAELRKPPTQKEDARGGLRVMIVEDQPLIGMDLEAGLAENGAEVACLATSAAQALAALDHVAIDAAVLDFDLGQETSAGVADELELRGIPFVFATGHGAANVVPERFAGHVLTHKPYDACKIMAVLNEAVAKGPGNERGEIPHA